MLVALLEETFTIQRAGLSTPCDRPTAQPLATSKQNSENRLKNVGVRKQNENTYNNTNSS